MSQYHTFTAHDAVAYAQQFAGIDNPSELVSAQEVGDGNLNLVFKVFDRQASLLNRRCRMCAASANPGR